MSGITHPRTQCPVLEDSNIHNTLMEIHTGNVPYSSKVLLEPDFFSVTHAM